MRTEFDREIDALLRGHVGGGGAAGRAGPAPGGAAAGAHLDADELSAFAENALPEAARARHAAHLADCDPCRRAATEIALASGAAEEIERREKAGAAVPASVSWRERLAAVFAPRAWRYAMPLVGLLAVATVVLVVMRRVPEQNVATEMARRAEPGAQTAQQSDQPAQVGAQPAQPGNEPQPGTAANTAPAPAGTYATSTVGAAQPAPVGVATGSGSGGSGAAPQSVTVQPFPDEAPPVASPQATPVPAAPPPPASAPRAVAEAASRDESRSAGESPERSEAKKKEGEQQSAELSASRPATQREQQQQQRSVPFNAQNQGPGGAEERSRNRQQAPVDRSARGRRDRDEDDSGETRRVGGRTFRRSRGAWIDTNYDSSQATVMVRYDSEQYRALMGDEPELGRIVGALGGEVIVVWKGRAYHFRP